MCNSVGSGLGRGWDGMGGLGHWGGGGAGEAGERIRTRTFSVTHTPHLAGVRAPTPPGGHLSTSPERDTLVSTCGGPLLRRPSGEQGSPPRAASLSTHCQDTVYAAAASVLPRGAASGRRAGDDARDPDPWAGGGGGAYSGGGGGAFGGGEGGAFGGGGGSARAGVDGGRPPRSGGFPDELEQLAQAYDR